MNGGLGGWRTLYSRGVRRHKYLLCVLESPREDCSINSLRPLPPKWGLLKGNWTKNRERFVLQMTQSAGKCKIFWRGNSPFRDFVESHVGLLWLWNNSFFLYVERIGIDKSWPWQLGKKALLRKVDRISHAWDRAPARRIVKRLAGIVKERVLSTAIKWGKFLAEF